MSNKFFKGGNEKIDNLIQEIQLETNYYCEIIIEWIPYDH
jgi:hypothetical protein